MALIPDSLIKAAVVYPLARALTEDVVRPSTKLVGKHIARRVRRLIKAASPTVATADRLLAEAGVDPRSVPPRIIVPLLEAASLEDDEALMERWAALLANAASGDFGAPVLPSFPVLLQQLAPLDVLILSKLFALLAVAPLGGIPATVPSSKSTDQRQTPPWGITRTELRDMLDVSPPEAMDVSLDSLIGLGLVEPEPRVRETLIASDGQGVRLTRLGWRFTAACSPPVRREEGGGLV